MRAPILSWRCELVWGAVVGCPRSMREVVRPHGASLSLPSPASSTTHPKDPNARRPPSSPSAGQPFPRLSSCCPVHSSVPLSQPRCCRYPTKVHGQLSCGRHPQPAALANWPRLAPTGQTACLARPRSAEQHKQFVHTPSPARSTSPPPHPVLTPSPLRLLRACLWPSRIPPLPEPLLIGEPSFYTINPGII